MNKEDAEKYLRLLGQELQKQRITGEILVHDDMYVLLDIKIPEIVDVNAYLTDEGDALETIDAYFGGYGVVLYQTVKRIAQTQHLSDEWLQSSINTLFSKQQNKWIEYLGIRVYEPALDYVFTMKIIASEEQYRVIDMVRLTEELKIVDVSSALSVIKTYIPSKLITASIRTRIKHFINLLGTEQREVVRG